MSFQEIKTIKTKSDLLSKLQRSNPRNITVFEGDEVKSMNQSVRDLSRKSGTLVCVIFNVD